MTSRFAPIATFPQLWQSPGAPVAYFPCDGPHANGSTADVRNLVPGGGYGARGTGVTWVNGPGGFELAYAGTGSTSVASAAYASFNLPVVHWRVKFRVDSLANTYTSIVSDANATTGLTILVKSNGKLAVYASNTTGGSFDYDGSGASTLSAGVYYTVDVLFTGLLLQGYVNGSLDASVAAVGKLQATGHALLLGDSASAGQKLTGRISDFRVYSPPQINQISADIADPLRFLHSPSIAAVLAAATAPQFKVFFMSGGLTGGMSP